MLEKIDERTTDPPIGPGDHLTHTHTHGQMCVGRFSEHRRSTVTAVIMEANHSHKGWKTDV